VHDHLSPGGVISQFVPVLFFDVDQFRGVIRTFLQVFPHSLLWYNRSELLLLGIKAEQPAFRPERLALLTSSRPIHEDLSQAHWGGPAEHLNDWKIFLASFLVGPKNLAALSAGGEIYRDDRPVLDYATTSSGGGNKRLVPILRLIRAHLSPAQDRMVDEIASGPDDWLRVEEIRLKNIDDIVTDVMLVRVQRLMKNRPKKTMIASLIKASQWNADNFGVNRLLGELFLAESQPRKAEPYFARAVKLRPNDGRSRRGLAQALQIDSRSGEAKPPTGHTPGRP
jgi:hypothetical protein